MNHIHYWMILLVLLLQACGDEKASSNDTASMTPSSIDMGISIADTGTEELPSNHERYAHCNFYDYMPGADRPQTYPDDALTRVDDTSITGRRIQISKQTWGQSQTPFVKKLLENLDLLDGWGINAGILMRFNKSVTHIVAEMSEEDLNQHVQLLMLDDEEALPHYPKKVAVSVETLSDGKILIFKPLFPLRAATRYGLVVKTHKVDEAKDDHCLAQSDAVRDILAARALPDLQEAYDTLVQASSWQTDEIAAATVFTTQSAHHTSFEVAALVKQKEYRWQGEADCESDGDYQHCIRAFNAYDFRKDGLIDLKHDPSTYTLKVHAWLPTERDQNESLATVLYGHGIGGDHMNAYQLVNLYRRPKFIIVAIDALHHGEHPTNDVNAVGAASVLNFFALDIATQTINALQARDHFRQSTYDKLQLLELLYQNPDIDGDGVDDVNTDQIGYYGLSLGGIMGVELLALDSRIRATVLAVAGAQLVTVLTEGAIVADFLPVIYQLVGGQDAFDTFLPLTQVLIDAADPASYAPFVIHQRIDDTDPPHLLMQMAMNDEVVPNSANRALARAFLIPHAQPQVTTISHLPEVDTPARLNLYDRTIALFQFDRVLQGDRAVASNHNNVPFSDEAQAQAKSFLNQWINKDEPSINNPYPLFDTPALE